MDLSTRQLRSFVVLAEELHFTRAAARLYVAQQALSRQIREMESRLGVRLLDRTTRRVALTPAGEAFLESARTALDVLDAGIARAGRIGRGEIGTLKLGFQPGAALELTAPILDGFRDRHPDVAVELREFLWDDPSAGVVSGWADVSLTRPPFAGDGIELLPLVHEPVVAAMTRSHRLAGRGSIRIADLLDEPMVVGRSADAIWTAHWTLADHRDGRPARIAMHTTSHTEELDVVAAGVGVMVTPAAAGRFTPHPAIAYVPIDDHPPAVLSVAWRSDERGPLVDAFLAVVRDVLDERAELVARMERGEQSIA
ncbi:transcriptional regulator LysR family [Patulibacter medicamentivorans]|uniref:Transcriptional regulator LysR family n=1 Tax=Patulibacter medicamentivorans TaxID=1097667 RepID=H0E3U1_9ACTN|nr:LysR substrate-binding domain-containing protein [Patulibacter medicamentivorans]EHN11660.1 transcriptional regulator LysR family [Patulibacter medicamentivorans]